MERARQEIDKNILNPPDGDRGYYWEDYVCLPPLWHDYDKYRVTISEPTSSLDLVKAAWGKCLASLCGSGDKRMDENGEDDDDDENSEEDPMTVFHFLQGSGSKNRTAKRTAVLPLVRICFDARSMDFLSSQWQILVRNNGGRSFRLGIRLLQCSFANQYALAALVDFLAVVGRDLKELSILNDVLADWAPTWNIREQELVSLLQGLQRVDYLPFLRFENMDLLGTNVGDAFHRLLSSENCNIRGLDFAVTSFDDEMFHPLLDGIREHARGLCFLDLGGTSSFDVQRFGMLVDALANSTTRNTLAVFHIEQIFDTEPDEQSRFRAFSVVARLLGEFPSLQRLVLMLFDLLQGVDSHTDEYLEFVNALAANTSVRFLEFFSDPINDNIAGPLFQALTNNSSLQELRIGSMRPEASRLSSSLENFLPAMEGLCSLAAPLDIQNVSLRQALTRNTILTRVIDIDRAGLDGTANLELLHSSGKVEKDREICKILIRNKLLRRVSNWQKDHHHEISFWVIWLLCMEQLSMTEREGVSAAFNFLLWSSPLLLNSLDVNPK